MSSPKSCATGFSSESILGTDEQTEPRLASILLERSQIRLALAKTCGNLNFRYGLTRSEFLVLKLEAHSVCSHLHQIHERIIHVAPLFSRPLKPCAPDRCV